MSRYKNNEPQFISLRKKYMCYAISDLNSKKWSTEFEFTRKSIKQNLPVVSGIYMLLQSEYYRRYKGKTRILKIGKSINLRHEIENHLNIHTCTNRIHRIKKYNKQKIFFKFMLVDNEKIDEKEKSLLIEFEDEFWDLPFLNSQRGYVRGEDLKYK